MTIVAVIAHTPIWVWPLYALLLFLGLQRTRDNSISVRRTLILPLAVTIFAVISFIVAGLAALPAGLVGLAIGTAIGWRLEPPDRTRRLPDGKVWLQGEWWSFAQIVAVLIFRYTINAVPVLTPLLGADPIWRIGTLAISAALSGLFLGRVGARLQMYFRAAPERSDTAPFRAI